jgi:tRNA-Thr(GGU) m(6)t(6)A37 methyltransferase TsaA
MTHQRTYPPDCGMDVTMRSIGVIHTPFKEQSGTPIQPRFAREAEGLIEVFEPYAEALADIDGFERLWLLFLLDRSKSWQPRVIPYLDTVKRGLFATRAPARPCPIGLSVVELLSVSENRLTVRGVDILDGTPLLDIKPYVNRFDAFPDSRAGWLDAEGIDPTAADSRFSDED